jgi:hypothetical protein
MADKAWGKTLCAQILGSWSVLWHSNDPTLVQTRPPYPPFPQTFPSLVKQQSVIDMM